LFLLCFRVKDAGTNARFPETFSFVMEKTEFDENIEVLFFSNLSIAFKADMKSYFISWKLKFLTSP
jgi:hypothetical protein